MKYEPPDRLMALYQWLEPALPWLTAIGIVMVLLSMVAIPWLLVSMSEDYFVAPRRDPDRGPVAWMIWVLRNSLALVLMLAGVLMLVLPGQGLLTILIGIMCGTFPGKYRLERWLVRHHSVYDGINWVRARWGRAPIQYPKAGQDG